MASNADYAVIPMQDILGLGQDSRMNIPSKISGNWEFRLTGHELTQTLADRLRDMVEHFNRDN